MQDDLSMILKGKLDIEKSVSNIDGQIKELQKRIKELNISINIDGIDKLFKDITKEVSRQLGENKASFYDSRETKKQINETIKDFKQLQSEIEKLNASGFKKGMTSTSFIDTGNGESVKKIVTEFNDELKNTIRITENINAETGKLVSIEKTVIDNIKQRNDEQEKLAEAIAKGREKAESKTLAVDRKEELLQANAINKALDEQYEEQERLKKQIREIALLKKQSEATIDNIVKSNDGADAKRATDLKNALSKVNPEAKDAKLQIRELNAEIKEFGVRSKEASSTSNSFSDSLKRFTAFYGIYDILQLGKRSIESMVESIFELDHALVELQKTSSLTGDSLNTFVRESYQIGKELSRTGADVINASAEFSKAGFGDGEIANLAKTALLLTNVGDGIKDVSEASGTLISAMKGFGIESKNAIDIVDKINAVSNSTASNFEDISFGLERMSGTLGMAGTSIDETIGMFTAVNEVLRNSEIVSSGISSTFMRMRGVSEETGEAVDGLKAKLERVYKTVGVSMVDSTGQLRDTFDVLDDLSKQWGSLTTNQKQWIATESAGIRQSKVFITLMEQWDTVQKSINTSLSSSGSAMQENEKFLNSLEGKVNNVKSAWEQLSATTINSDFVKGVLDITAELIRLVDACNGAIPVILALGAAFAIFKFSPIVNGIELLTLNLMSMIPALQGATGAVVGLNTALSISIAGAVVAGIMAIGYAIKYVSEETQRAESKVSELGAELNKLNSNTQSVEGLAKQYEELKKLQEVQGLNNEQQQEFYDIQNQIKELLPDVNGYYDEQGRFIISNAESMQTLIEKQQEYIDLKRQEYADASKVTFAAHSDDYKNQKTVLAELIELKELEDKVKSGDISYDEKGRRSELVRYYYSDLQDLDKAIKEMSNTSDSSLKKVQQDLLNVMYATDEWKNSTDEQKSAIQEFISTSKDIKSLEGYFSNTGASVEKLSSGLKLGAKASLDYKNGTIDTATYMSQMTKASDLTGVSVSELNDVVGKHTEEVEKASEVAKDYAVDMDEIRKNASDARDDLDELNVAIEKVQKGEALTGEEIVNLRTKHEGLNPILDKTTGLYTIQANELIKVRDEYKNTSKDGIQAEIDLTKQKLQSVQQRIKLDGLEVKSLNSKADVYKSQQAFQKAKVQGLSSMYGNFDSMPSSIRDRLTEDNLAVSEDVKVMDESLKTLAQLYAELENFDIAQTNTSSKTKKDKKKDDAFSKDVDKIKQAREEIEREIGIIQSKLDLSEMQGDSKAFDEYSNKMTTLLAKQKELADVEIGKFNALKGKYKKEEEQLTLNEAIAESTRAKYADEKEYLEQTISLIQRKTDLEKRAYDDKLKQIELSQILMDENSSEYAKAEEEKMAMLLQSQSQYEEKIIKLKQLGLSNESTLVREYVSMWTDAEEKRLNLVKSMAEKRRQIEIENLNTQKDQLQKQYDDKKSQLDMTIEMLKEEGKAKQQAVKDELSNMKKIADEKKRLLKKEQDQLKFDREVDSANEEIKTLQGELNKIMFDNSDWAKAERARLTKQLEDKQKALEDKYSDDKLEKEMDSIDEQVKLFEDKKNKELEIIEKTDLSEVELKKKALDMIDRNNKELYSKLKKYNTETLKMSQTEFDRMWESANKGLENFGINSKSTLETLFEMTKAIENMAKQAELLGKSPITYDATVNTPNTGNNNTNKPSNNSQNQALLNEQKYLHNLMVQAQKENNKQLIEWVKKRRKELGLDPNTGAIPTRHNGILGGFAGNGLLPNEVLVKATTDELFLNKGQQDLLTKNIIGLQSKRSQLPNVVFDINITGVDTPSIKPYMETVRKEWTKDIYKIVNESMS